MEDRKVMYDEWRREYRDASPPPPAEADVTVRATDGVTVDYQPLYSYAQDNGLSFNELSRVVREALFSDDARQARAAIAITPPPLADVRLREAYTIIDCLLDDTRDYGAPALPAKRWAEEFLQARAAIAARPVEALCPDCHGSGEGEAMEGRGPDAYTVTIPCPKCGGYGAIFAQAIARPAEVVEMSPDFTDTARAALLWVLWHHQGGSSKVGQPIRYALGMGQHDRLNEHQVREAKLWGALAAQPVAREPMSDAEIRQLADAHLTYGAESGGAWLEGTVEFARALEAKHGIGGKP